MAKQRTALLWGGGGGDQVVDTGAQLSSRLPGASPSPMLDDGALDEDRGEDGGEGEGGAQAAAEAAESMPDWGGFITPRGPPAGDRSLSERAKPSVEPIHEEEAEEEIPTHQTRDTADQQENEGAAGDGRTQAPLVVAADAANPAHSLNDAYIHSMRFDHSSHAPGAVDADTLQWAAAEFNAAGGVGSLASSRGRSRSEVAPGVSLLGSQLPANNSAAVIVRSSPSASPHATPQRRVEGSMLLRDDDSSSAPDSSSEDDGLSPGPRFVAALDAAAVTEVAVAERAIHSPPKSTRSASTAAAALQALQTQSAAEGFGVAWQNLASKEDEDAMPLLPSAAVAAATSAASAAPVSSFAAASSSSAPNFPPSSGVADSHSRSSSFGNTAGIPLGLRPQPPAMPPPSYSARDKSFGRFHRGRLAGGEGGAARSPSKPLSQFQAQIILQQQRQMEAQAAEAVGAEAGAAGDGTPTDAVTAASNSASPSQPDVTS